MNTTNPEKLKRVVQLLADRRQEIDSYFQSYIFKPYDIDVKNCLIEQKIDDAKRLLDFSFTTRQGGQNKTASQKYKKDQKHILKMLNVAIAVLVDDDWTPKQRYQTALALISSLDNVGQKIASMFIKFLVYYSKEFKGKKHLERELFVPIDAHVARLLFTKFNGQKPNRLNLYDESIQQTSLKYEFQTKPIRLHENKTARIQRQIRQDFDEIKLNEPPIILDYLWYVGYMHCSRQIGDIGCKVCFLNSECASADN